MLLLLWVLLGVKMRMMKAEDVTHVSVLSGGTVLLGFSPAPLLPQQDVRWTHDHLMLSLRSSRTSCEDEHCVLLPDGSLRLWNVTAADAGLYRQEVFQPDGQLQSRQDFLLSLQNSAVGPVLGTIIPLLFFIVFIVLIVFGVRRKRQTTPSKTERQENEYMVMHAKRDNQSNKMKDEGEEERTQEESHYVAFHPAVSMETPTTQQCVCVDDSCV